jgi:DAK2 domain fusion protein YloV
MFKESEYREEITLKYTSIDGQLLKEMIINGAYELENNKVMVNALNVFPVPDGDTGTNMSATMMSAVTEIEKNKATAVHTIVDSAAMGSLMGARGNSGVILSQLLRGFSKHLKGKKTINTKDFAGALKEGANTAYRAVMKPTEGTILTVARETGDRAIEIAKQEDDFLFFMDSVYNAATEILNKTPDMLPVLKQAGVVDAGGKGLLLIYFGFLKRLQEKITKLNKAVSSFDDSEVELQRSQFELKTEDIKFAYCTEFFINAKDPDLEAFKEKLIGYGDSIVVVGTETLIKAHIHTNEPGTVLNEAIKIGELTKIKVENMKEQHRSIIEENDNIAISHNITKLPEKEYGIVTVAAGEGVINIFKDLGADVVIEGGQTMNPSTQDIVNAIESINAKSIFVLPNNGNIVMAAEQARDVSTKDVKVIPTKSIPQGITAVVAMNPDATIDENEKEMNLIIANVKTGQVTYAVRDTIFNDVEIKEGNYLGIYNGKLINSHHDLNIITEKLLDNMVDENSELITILFGNDLSEEDTLILQDYASDKFKQCDISFNYGGQPLYYYIISVE